MRALCLPTRFRFLLLGVAAGETLAGARCPLRLMSLLPIQAFADPRQSERGRLSSSRPRYVTAMLRNCKKIVTGRVERGREAGLGGGAISGLFRGKNAF